MVNLTRNSNNYLYTAWLGMVRRCTKPTHPAWNDYGGRGISVCTRWNRFEAFVQDMGERPTDGHTLDRRDNNSGYSPDNCRWATMAEQAKNRRKPRSRHDAIRVDGLTLSEFSKLHGINHSTLRRRYRDGKRGRDLLAPDLRDGSHWRGKRRNPDGTMMDGSVVLR